MKRYLILLTCIGIITLFLTSCLKEYLDKAPESGLTEQEVFSKYANFLDYFDQVFDDANPAGNASILRSFPHYFAQAGQKFSVDALTDLCDQGRVANAQPIKGGIYFPYNSFWDGNAGFFVPLWRATRIANVAIEKINLIQDVTPEDKNDLLAQAYFVRGFSLFMLFRTWGPMPHLTKSLGAEDFPWDFVRPSKHETCLMAAADLDSAVYYYGLAGRMRRDAGPGQPGHLSSPDQFRPNGVAAKAIRARVLLYGASPLNNEHGQADWEEAAIANWDAIETALQYQYDLLPAADYTTNWSGVEYNNEMLWGWYSGNYNNIHNNLFYLLCPVMTGAAKMGNVSGSCPTQNHVDQYETKWGDPLNTQADRAAATALGHYNEQDPYVNRDPRFDINIIYNQATLAGFQSNKAQIWYQMVSGKPSYSELLNQLYATSQTGYYQRKRWGGQSVKNQVSVKDTDPAIRLTEVYLNYAEAANEAYGPNTPAPGATMTAVQAINKIRNRIGMADVLPQFTGSRELFRDRIKNERTIELSFEDHRFFDLRRWMDAPAAYAGPLYGMGIEKVTASPAYPTGYKYTRDVVLPPERQIHWVEPMYYFCYNSDIYYLLKKFDTYERW
ncbi:MAG: RagB/SusD family nutrient uptake outer membrane protein [Bacteroidia bacterium]|nr:RagB/SusD family nutrient uptake outer membrane protein [Bacteroidia bacterium]